MNSYFCTFPFTGKIVYLLWGITTSLFKSLPSAIEHLAVKAHFSKVNCPKIHLWKLNWKEVVSFGNYFRFYTYKNITVHKISTVPFRTIILQTEEKLRFYDNTWNLFLQHIFKCLLVCAMSFQRKTEEMLLSTFMNFKRWAVSGRESLALFKENGKRLSNHFYFLSSFRWRNFNMKGQELCSAHLHTLPQRNMLQTTARVTYAPFILKQASCTRIKSLLSVTFISIKFA